MNMTIGPGAIVIATILAGGRVCSVQVHSTRPIGLARVFHGRPVEEIPALAERLFTLCGFSHAVAAKGAIDAALARVPSASDRFSSTIGLLAERVSESLKSCVIGWPLPDAVNQQLVEAMLPLRDAIVSAREIMAAARSGLCHARRRELVPVADRLAGAVAALGLAGEAGEPMPGSFLAGIMAEVCEETAFLPCTPDPLSSADDLDVVAELRSGGAQFASLPALPGRRIETGAFARRWQEAPIARSPLAARLNARLFDTTKALFDLKKGLESGDTDDAELTNFGKAPDGGAYAAVESPRGRLYHCLDIGKGGRIASYELLAPTEWNLHPAGPLVAALLGAKVGAADEARPRIGRLASLFDPCVAFRVDCKEAGHA
ncbi:MAG: nickel-dependent hydrogenase large subunit [Beijerinckiaceae bacterium]